MWNFKKIVTWYQKNMIWKKKPKEVKKKNELYQVSIVKKNDKIEIPKYWVTKPIKGGGGRQIKVWSTEKLMLYCDNLKKKTFELKKTRLYKKFNQKEAISITSKGVLFLANEKNKLLYYSITNKNSG